MIQTSQNDPGQPHNGGVKRYLKKYLIPACVLIVIVGLGVGVYYHIYGSDPIPRSVSSQVNFPLYYPSALPRSWSLEKSSIFADAGEKVVGYSLRGPNGELNLTIQPAPANFDFTSFYTKRLLGTVQFLTPLGQGAVGTDFNQQLVGSLITPSSWVLASPGSGGRVTKADIQFILSHLQAIN